MIPLALATGMVVTFSDGIDWSKASDDLKFGWLKPVMTEAEVKRLFAGKTSDRQACGMATNLDGKLVPYSGGSYGYTLTGRVQTGITFDMHGPTLEEQEDAKAERDTDPPEWNLWTPRAPKPAPKRTLAGFRVDRGATYKRNKDGLYVALPKK